jgi:hypothetical protein
MGKGINRQGVGGLNKLRGAIGWEEEVEKEY